MLPFLVQSTEHSVRLFELADGRFQLLEAAPAGPFLGGHGYLLVESDLATFLVQQGVQRITCEDAVLFDRPSGSEFFTHVRIQVEQYFTPDQIRDLDLTGPRLLTMNDEYYFVSPALRDLLQHASFDYLAFSEGLGGFGGAYP
jgi:hypothetical protein